MKKLSISMMLIFLAGSLMAQYTIRTANIPTPEAFVDLVFIDSSRGVALGLDKVYTTIDAGENWSLSFQDTSIQHFQKINHIGDSIIVNSMSKWNGPSRTVFRFGSSSYRTFSLPNTYNYAYLDPVLYADSMWAYGGYVGGGGFIATRQSGFRLVASSGYMNVKGDTASILATQGQWRNFIYYSTNNGQSWDTIKNVPRGSQSEMINSQTFFIVDHQWYNSSLRRAYRTTNGGQSWDTLNQQAHEIPSYFHFPKPGLIVGVAKGLFYYSNNNAQSFDSLPFTSSSPSAFRRAEMSIHSPNKYFAYSDSDSGLFIIEPNTITSLEVTEPGLKEINVFPNPTSGILNIERGKIAWEQLLIYNISGREIKRFNQEIKQIDLSELQSGLYFLKFRIKGVDVMKKLIIK